MLDRDAWIMTLTTTSLNGRSQTGGSTDGDIDPAAGLRATLHWVRRMAMAGARGVGLNRERARSLALLSAALLALSSCSDRQRAESEQTIPSPATGVERTTVTVDIPPADPAAAAAAIEQVRAPIIFPWLTEALAAAGVVEACTTAPPLMTVEVSAAATEVADQVLAELLVNLDGTLGGVAAACEVGDIDVAQDELAAAKAASAAIEQRMQELGS